jgi:prepilin-type N-terminal cleavage/methylation domain-containing protein/prepilin-type processing-associated H-X9-DG protein
MKLIHTNRRGVTLLELLVVIAIMSLLMGLLLSAVQQVRQRATRLVCSNQLKQIALATHHHHDAHNQLPMGHHAVIDVWGLSYTGWTLSLLPYLEYQAVYQESLNNFRSSPLFNLPPHQHLSTVIPAYICPADSRVSTPQLSLVTNKYVAFTSYLGVSGRDYSTRDGVLLQSVSLNMSAVTDGVSNTLLIGERPPSSDFQFGWWYAGVGQRGTGSTDLIMGVYEENIRPIMTGSPCGPGHYRFKPNRIDNPCAMYHYWSLHSGGANFAFVDGSVRFLTYDAVEILPALATRQGNEVQSIP